MKIKLYMIEENGKYVTTFRKRQLKQFIIDTAVPWTSHYLGQPFKWANTLFHKLEEGHAIALTPSRCIKLCDRYELDTSKLSDKKLTEVIL